jgi:hypothetical protein
MADISKILKTQNCSSNGDLSLCQILWLFSFSFFLSFFPWTMNLSTADPRNYWTEFHWTWWSYRYMFLVGPKDFSFVTMWNFWGIVAAILKMATGRNCSMWGINSGYHYLPIYKILMISDNVEFLPPIFYVVYIPSWFPTLNNFYRSPFSKWPPQYLKNSTLSDIIKIWYVGR